MEQLVVFAALILALALFAWGRLRHDLVAFLTLTLLVLTGVVQPESAFVGFGHPAVITVAAVLVVGKALEFSGLVDLLGKWVAKLGDQLLVQIAALSTLVALASAFMNNVGALAIMMPVAIQLARKGGHPPSLILMPIAFASLLGGMTTLIGTPPNIIIATFRGEETGRAFGLFDFAPVGAALAVAGIAFITLAGWRLLPRRRAQKAEDQLFDIEDYITEVKVPKNSKADGVAIEGLAKVSKADVQILGVIRHGNRIHAPGREKTILENDILILETDTDELKTFMEDTGAKLAGGKKFRKDAEGADKIALAEAIVMAGSPLIGNTAASLRLRGRFGVNLLAVARREQEIRRRLNEVRFRVGDVLLLQGREPVIDDTITSLGCIPLAQRGLRLGYQTKIPLAVGIFAFAIGLVVTGWMPVQIAFSLAAVSMVLTGILPLKNLYESIDWPVIVLLGAMIPVGVALETSGGSDRIASLVLEAGTQFPPWVLVGILLVLTMFLSDLINNAATVVLMAPIAIGVARGLGVSIDPFLMAVAVGGSCAFLTPIGHQSNTLVMGPGGYKFTDYWRMGLPLEGIIVAAGLPLILLFWPV